MELFLPAEIGDGRLDTILKIFRVLSEKPKKLLRINWGRVEEISPAGFAILACMSDVIIEQKAKVRHLHVKKKIKEYSIVEKLMHATEHTRLPEPSFYNQDQGGALVEGHNKTFGILFADKALSQSTSKVNDDLRFSIKLILNELMINTVDHSTAERYYLYAGVWKGEFHAGVLDMGVTIPAKLKQKYTFLDDREALRLSLKEGISTRRIRTGGLGLFHTMESLKYHQGRLTIVSREAQLRKYFERRKTDVTTLKSPLAGTWCFTRFPL